MNEFEMKENILRVFNEVSFRKFGNAFRKTINPYFKSENHLKSRGGIVGGNFTFQEFASYVIGDGSYSVNESQYEAFMKEINKK